MDQRRRDELERSERGFQERSGTRKVPNELRCGISVHGRDRNYKCGAVAKVKVTRTGFATIVEHACADHAKQMAGRFPLTTTVEWLQEPQP